MANTRSRDYKRRQGRDISRATITKSVKRDLWLGVNTTQVTSTRLIACFKRKCPFHLTPNLTTSTTRWLSGPIQCKRERRKWARLGIAWWWTCLWPRTFLREMLNAIELYVFDPIYPVSPALKHLRRTLDVSMFVSLSLWCSTSFKPEFHQTRLHHWLVCAFFCWD